MLIPLIALVVLILTAVVFWLSRQGSGAFESAAYRRAAALGQTVALSHRAVAAEAPEAGAEELKVLALARASGKSEAEVRALVDEAKGTSELHSSLRMLATRLAVQAERGREENREAQRLRAAIADAQRAVRDTVPDEL